jgi:hypothetical protein
MLISAQAMFAMETFYTSINPFCVFARSLGFFPLDFDEKGHLKCTKWSLAQTALGITVILSQTTIVFCRPFQFYVNASNFFDTTLWSLFLDFLYPTIILQFCVQMWKMKDIKKFLRLMYKTDVKINSIRVFLNHTRHLRVVRFLVCFSILVSISKFLLSLLYHKLDDGGERMYYIEELSYGIYTVFECFFTLQFIVTSFLLRERFKALKSFLK